MTTKSQKVFEADYIARDNGSGITSPKHDDGTYFSNFQQEAWEKWQAAESYGRKQALEEALKLAEDQRLDLDGSEYHRAIEQLSKDEK
jgi:hypothetical protein